MNRILQLVLLFYIPAATAQTAEFPVGDGWAGNSVNTVVFRKNSVDSHENGTQFTAYYDPEGRMVIACREAGSPVWTVHPTRYTGNVLDAHNSISIAADSEGYLHVSWDHHGNPLNYARSVAPFSPRLGDREPMTGCNEDNITYPEFFRMGSHLIFMYRDGRSGQGNLVMNRYDTRTREWTQLHDLLIDGQGERNAYWQACTDSHGTLHLSWVWRESPDVASNHDLCYARSRDGGISWERSDGTRYDLPITASTAEYACLVPQGSELINQTSMTADKHGNPYIATYWRDAGSPVPQYRIVYVSEGRWKAADTGFRSEPFTLSGTGTKSIPISRPQIMAADDTTGTKLYMLFRDEERGGRVSLAECTDPDGGRWQVRDLTDYSVGAWEPTYDTERWRRDGVLDIFVQKVVQVDGEGTADTRPEKVVILEYAPE
ncbi:MAG: BNR repeat-containing protein [Alistipes sp.]|nr:BNR repeat-containing protein [Alistipes sp.]